MNTGSFWRPLVDGRADAVFGSRFMSSGERRVLYFWHSLANHLLTGMCNIFADLNLTDMETCYKAFRTSLLQSIPIRSQRFGFEPEITIKLAKRQARIYETPISYNGRTYEEGKKIGLKDAFEAFWVILKNALYRATFMSLKTRTFWMPLPAHPISIAGWRTPSGRTSAEMCSRSERGWATLPGSFCREEKDMWPPTLTMSIWSA